MKALITGITGQVGSYLAEFLLAKGYEVHGIVRRSSSINTRRIDHVFDRLHLHYGDLLDADSLRRALAHVRPDEVYNLGAQSHVRVSFDMPVHTADAVGLGTLRLLEAVRDVCPHARFYQASSSEMFGDAPAPQNELTPFKARSPYAAAKIFAHQVACNYRDAYGLKVSCGILFNTESPRRGETFVTRKITRGVAAIRAGTQATLALGNLDARRDWGFAGDYVRAIWGMLQTDPDDFVIGTGRSHTVLDFLHLAAEKAGVEDILRRCTTDERLQRPTEVPHLCADASKAKDKLGWTPQVSFERLVDMMVRADLERVGILDPDPRHEVT